MAPRRLERAKTFAESGRPDLATGFSFSCTSLANCQEASHPKSEAARKREQFKSGQVRSVSAPPRKRWFRKETPLSEVEAPVPGLLCDEITKRLIGAIAWWHDIHSNLLQLSFEESAESLCPSSASSVSSISFEDVEDRVLSDEEEQEAHYHALDDASDLRKSARQSLSSPDITATQLDDMFPQLSEYWRLFLMGYFAQ
ncbi:unnamed protein product, partial [Mesorhabditis spiculigera]